MISNIHLWNTSETFGPLVATVVNLQRERGGERETRRDYGGGSVDFISLEHVMLYFRGTLKISKVSLLSVQFILLSLC